MLNQNTYRLKIYKSLIPKAEQNIILLSMFLQIWIQPFNSHLECFIRQDWWTFRSAGSVAIMKVVQLGAPQTATSSWHRPGHKQWDNWNTELQLQSHTLPLLCSYLTNETRFWFIMKGVQAATALLPNNLTGSFNSPDRSYYLQLYSIIVSVDKIDYSSRSFF